MTEITPGALIDLIDGLDHVNDDDFLDLTRWDRGGSGSDDEHLTAVTRRLARERLDTFSIEEVGMEVLRRIDARTAV